MPDMREWGVFPGRPAARFPIELPSPMRLLSLLLAAVLAGSAADARGQAPPAAKAPPAAAKHRFLPDEPRSEPRPIRSRHFSFLSDVSDREAKEILERLERMTALLEKYFGRRLPGVIEGFIVHDLAVWPEGVLVEPLGVEKIREPAGVCFTTVLGPHRRATLYSCDDPRIIQHECTHGFCHLVFGGVGPPWLAEGLAEMGRWWEEREKETEVDPVVWAILRDPRLPRPGIHDIVAPETRPAEPRDYVWRWALCHLLVENPNFADRFRTLAVALMEGRPGASFETAFAPVGREVAFEFDRFLADAGNGYRTDLAAWPWKAKHKRLAPRGSARAKVKAAAGWQSSGVEVTAGETFVIEAEGSWRVATGGDTVGPAGSADGSGRLVGALFADFTLSGEFPLGPRADLVAPADGVLMLRCGDAWTGLSDNDGTLTVTIRRKEAP